MAGPLRFIPFLRPMVWGGRRLGTMLGKLLPAGGLYGESWEVSDHSVHRSVAAAGPAAGRSLRDLMENDRPALLGAAAATHDTFPWLIKFLDAADWLSVQVHPNEAAVRRLLPGEGSKTEAWFVIDAVPGSRIYAGLLPGIGEKQLRTAIQSGNVAKCLHHFDPRPGECVFLPAGTVHAVGGGVLMAEVQQTSDATFRLFDWNRRDREGKQRTLHVEQALACIDWDRGPVEPVRVAFPPPARSVEASAQEGRQERAGHVQQALVRCPYFALEYLRADQPFTCGGEGRLQAVIVLNGCGRLAAGTNEELTAGQVWLLPATMEPARCEPGPGFATLLCTLP